MRAQNHLMMGEKLQQSRSHLCATRFRPEGESAGPERAVASANFAPGLPLLSRWRARSRHAEARAEVGRVAARIVSPAATVQSPSAGHIFATVSNTVLYFEIVPARLASAMVLDEP